MPKRTLSLRQARVYWDGHERKDVKKRRKEYLEELDRIEPFMATYEGPDMVETPPSRLDEDGKEHVIIVHDESGFHANDYKADYWLKGSEQVLKKKDKGRLIMVSGFLCQRYGNVALTEQLLAENSALPEGERLKVTDSRVTIYPSSRKSGDDYWNMEQMIEQLQNTIPIAHRLYPNAVIHWIFDNSSCHGSLAKDALTATKMNVNPGGKNVPHMHDTVLPEDNPWGLGGWRQTMQFDPVLPDDDEFKAFEGQPKGMRRILHERGLLKPGMVGDCQGCKQSKLRKAHVTGLTEDELNRIDEDEELDTDDEEDGRPTDCCMRRLIEEAGDVCHFLPKFHPELNPIEYYWGWSKNYFRERSNGNFARAKKLVQEALDACPLLTIRRFFRRAFRYVSVYRLGVTGIAAEFAVRKFKSHRHVRMTDLEQAEAERKAKLARETKRSLG
ncbi:hypothetical protein ONZ51_g10884 [Trametes cubensis]|uniref:Tc1-like transposase DDE domain-containing protein n=1 Tax=Trametes cubensis TaxID=1111947 RepID=A0AAD7TL92_9APHY|nr:hypothetical protein ONZ51_g10884 [Trametes cubensis]